MDRRIRGTAKPEQMRHYTIRPYNLKCRRLHGWQAAGAAQEKPLRAQFQESRQAASEATQRPIKCNFKTST